MNAKNSRVTVHTDCVGVILLMIGEIEISNKHIALTMYNLNRFIISLSTYNSTRLIRHYKREII